MNETIDFFLVPDSSAARCVRRELAARHGWLGLVVGTWPELLVLVREAWLLFEDDAWDALFYDALKAFPDAFWSRSFSVAPEAVAQVVETEMRRVLAANEPAGPVTAKGVGKLGERPRRHVGDILKLIERLGGRLPPDLATVQQVITGDQASLRDIRVHHFKSFPELDRWQSALLAHINERAGEPNQRVSNALDLVLRVEPAVLAGSALHALQTALFDQQKTIDLDDSVQWIGVRDPREEVEIVTGMIQQRLAANPDLTPADMGVLVPSGAGYGPLLAELLDRAGLPMAGLDRELCINDLGREAVLHFLYCRQKPAPAMAVAALLDSPLMPWDAATGNALAQGVMDGDWTLAAPKGSGNDAQRMLALIRGGETADSSRLAEVIHEFFELLQGDEAHRAHMERAREACGRVLEALAGMPAPDWPGLRSRIAPTQLPGETPAVFTQEGVTILEAGREPWRRVRHLFVLGFVAGQYPPATRGSPVFSPEDLVALREHMGWAVETPETVLTRRRECLCRQLRAASATVSFLIPHRDFSGAEVSASDTLVFMARLFGAGEAGELVREIDHPGNRGAIRDLACAPAADAVPPKTLKTEDLDFGRDLRIDPAKGGLRRESPSSLERLIVSPLAWLFRRAGAQALEWAPEHLDAALKGTLAHAVFEQLFVAGQKLPGPAALRTRVPALLQAAVRRLAPFLLAGQWLVECRHLETELIEAAVAWLAMLKGIGAKVLANEVWLRGSLNGIPVHGQADALLGLAQDRLLVVDYKKAKSRARRERMEAGFDSQADLYRIMIETGGPADPDHPQAVRIANASDIGIVYYMLNDQHALAGTALTGMSAPPGWESLEGDVSGAAMACIGERLTELGRGIVRLPRDSDEEFFRKQARLTPYALEDSPLLRLFTVTENERVV